MTTPLGRIWLVAAVPALVALGVASCDMNYQKGVVGSAGVSVTVVDLHGFVPDSIDIPVNTTVTFGWNGTNSRQHNFTFTDSSIPASPTQLFGTYQVTFTAPGSYHYICTVHGAAAEHGVVVVH